MVTAVGDFLSARFASHDVHRQLHDIAPHAVYEVSVDGRRAVCKLGRGPQADPLVEARAIEYAAEHTDLPVPEVLAADRTGFLTAWHEGAPQDPEAITVDEARAEAMGDGLARLHDRVDLPAYGPLRAEEGLTVDARETWADALLGRLEAFRAFLEPKGYGEVARAVAKAVRDRRGLLADAGPPTLLHGNFLPEHVGIEDGTVTCVIDWEHAFAGPGEYDYVRAAIPMFDNPSRPTGDAERAAFRQGYESVRELPEGFERRRALYRLVISVSFLQALYVQRGGRDPDDEVTDRAERGAERIRSDLETLERG